MKKIMIAMLIAVQSLFGQFSGKKAFEYLEKQVAFGSRVPGSEAHRKTAEYLIRFFKNLNFEVLPQPFIHYDSRKKGYIPMQNIIIRIAPEKSRRIILCAHWDSRPVSDKDLPEKRSLPLPGANDGASGVAVLMHLAELWSENPPPVGIDIVLFDGEDYGPEGKLDEYFLGSRFFVRNNPLPIPIVAILLDMVGDRELNLKKERYSLRYAGAWVDRIWKLAQQLGYYQFIQEEGYFIEDDHVILNQAGIPAVNIIDFEYPDSRNSFWHTQNDVPANCSPQSLECVGDVLYHFIMYENWRNF